MKGRLERFLLFILLLIGFGVVFILWIAYWRLLSDAQNYGLHQRHPEIYRTSPD